MYKNHVWSYDFVAERTSDGRTIRMLNIIDEYTRECLAIRVERKITANDVIDTLADVFIRQGMHSSFDLTMDMSLLHSLYVNGFKS
jgi:hypothetical protein